MDSWIQEYITENYSDKAEETKKAVLNYITRYCNLLPQKNYNELNRSDFIDAFSKMNLLSRNAYITGRTYIVGYARWIKEKYGYEQPYLILKSINRDDVDKSHIYQLYCFRNYSHLSDSLDKAVQLSNEEKGIFEADMAKRHQDSQVIATLLWFGFELQSISEIEKTDVLDSCVVHPFTKERIALPETAIDLIVDYKNSSGYPTSRVYADGRVGVLERPFKEGDYLLRNYKSHHLSYVQLNNSFKYLNCYDEIIGKKFVAKKIHWSGLCYKAYHDEQNNGVLTRSDFNRIIRLFNIRDNDANDIKVRRTFNQYQEFKEYMLGV